jgi:undecaprenyl-diphosphatase
MALDVWVHRFLLEHRSSPLTALFKLATYLGSSAVVIPLIVVLGVVCWVRRRSLLPLGLLASSYAGAVVLEMALKRVVGRARPPLADRLVQATGYAFPSGHATIGTAVWTTIGLLLAWATPGRRMRWALAGTVGTVILLVDLSRVYLGVHWLSDVVSGSVIGGGWAAAVVLVASAVVGRDRLVRPERRAGRGHG